MHAILASATGYRHHDKAAILGSASSCPLPAGCSDHVRVRKREGRRRPRAFLRLYMQPRSQAVFIPPTWRRRLPSMELVSSGDGYPQLRTTVGQHRLRRHGADPRQRPSTAVHRSPSMEGEAVDAELRLAPPHSGGASAVAAESKYVKVSVEGARYQRTVDLRAYGGHAELRAALLGLAGQMLGLGVTYEDNDGDILLAGDLPWDMFVSDCRSIRIMRRSTMMTNS